MNKARSNRLYHGRFALDLDLLRVDFFAIIGLAICRFYYQKWTRVLSIELSTWFYSGFALGIEAASNAKGVDIAKSPPRSSELELSKSNSLRGTAKLRCVFCA
ncbi:hypothetical protein N9J52_02745 [Flavobacteriales bacterium]|nr:hypothetical protein [Flavobacteriales bacterium]